MHGQYSWMREALADVRDSDGERVSELIADTVGGRTRAQLTEQQQGQTQQQLPQHQQRQQSSTGVNVSGRSSIISSNNGVEDMLKAFARRLEQHPQPGEGARRLHQMVQQPFSVKFGIGSAREIELQRAGSSRPPLTPFFKDAEPDILHDSPRLVPFAHSIGTQTHQRISSSIPPQPHSRQILSPTRPPTPSGSASDHFHRPPVALSSLYSTSHRRAHSLSDFPPLYDFSKRPLTHIRHNSSSCAPDPNFYRRRFINSLLRDVRRVKELESKLEGRREELDEACRRDADELSTIRRERELLVRELEMQSREYAFEQREGSRSNSRQQPILKHSSSYPSDGTKKGITANKVNFANPICTAREYSPSPSSSMPQMAKNQTELQMSGPSKRISTDSNKQRKQGQQCIAYEAEFSAQQQRNAMAQRRAARGGKQANTPVNPSSIFHFVPSRPT